METINISHNQSQEIIEDLFGTETNDYEDFEVDYTIEDKIGRNMATILGFYYPKITDVQTAHPPNPRSKRTQRKQRIPFRVDFSETDNAYFLKAELPGISSDQVDVHIDRGILRVSANYEKEPKEEKLHMKERCSGEVSRTFRLPFNANSDDLTTRFLNGILCLRFWKKEGSRYGKIVEL